MRIIEVITQGPQGPQGPQGLQGPTGSFNSASFATTGSNTFKGNQIITGSNGRLTYTGTTPVYPYTLAELHINNDYPWLERFYNDTFSTSSAVMAYFGYNDGRFVFHNESTQSIGLQVNGYSAENGLLVYSDKVAFVNNVVVTGSLNVSGSITGSLQGTASFATTASYFNTSNLATTGSNQFNGNQTITGSLIQGLEGNIATGEKSHAEGDNTQAIGNSSHAEGLGAIAYGNFSHAEGQDTIASGSHSHAEGNQTIALADHQHVQGKYNAVSSVPAAFIVGNGTDSENRSNLIHAAGNEVEITGSLNVNGSITGSLFGTASYAVTASYFNTSNLATTGSVTFTGNQIVTGSTRGNVTALSIASNTASIDLSVGNFFTLQLVSGSNTYINTSNILPGQTSILTLSTTGSATVSWPSTVKQPSGSVYVPTTTTGIDIITLASVNTSSLYVVSIKNMI